MLFLIIFHQLNIVSIYRQLILIISNLLSQCLQFSGQICINGFPLGLDKLSTISDSIIGLWNFDQLESQKDISQAHNSLSTKPLPGPGMGSQGFSAYFNTEYLIKIPHHDEYNRKTISITFWIFPLGSSEQFSSILRKATKETDYTPSLLLWPNTDPSNVGGGQIEVILLTASGKENLRSRGSLAGRRWSHVSLIIQNTIVQLFFNGLLDSQITLTAMPIQNNGPFYIGGDPWISGPVMYLDELVFYNRGLLPSEVYKMSRTPGQINRKLTYLGCDACTYHQAMNSCRSGFHLCSLPEVTAGVFQQARAYGWLRFSRDIWYRTDEIDEELVQNYLDPKISKAGICCFNSFF